MPGAGRAYDALALAASGFARVVALELSPSACDAAKREIEASGHPRAASVEVCCGDFFRHTGAYDLVWDCTFLCALDPSVRERWAAAHRSLLKPQGRRQ